MYNLSSILLIELLSYMSEEYAQVKDNFVGRVISDIMVDVHNVYVVSDNSSSSAYVTRVISLIQKPVTYVSSDALNENRDTFQQYSACILVFEDIDVIIDIFESSLLKFARLKPILIFYPKTESFDREPFSEAVNVKGFRLFVVRGFLPNNNQSASLTDLQNNVTIYPSHTEEICDRIPPSWRPNLNYDGKNRSLKVSTFNCPPFMILDGNETTVQGGIEYEEINYIAQGIPVKWHVHRSDTYKNRWGHVVDDVRWGKDDVAGCSQWLNFKEDENLRSSYPSYPVCFTFLVSKPQLSSEMSYVFLPMRLHMWLIMLACSGCVVAFLYGLVWVKYFIKPEGCGQMCKYSDVTLTATYTVRIMTSAGVPLYPPPNQVELRLILTFWSISCMILATVYSAGFTSILSYPPRNSPMTTFKDMAINNVVIDLKGLTAPLEVIYSPNPELKSLTSHFSDDPTLIQKAIDDGRYATAVKVLANAFITETENFPENLKQNLIVLKECIGNYYTVYVFTKNSPYYQMFNERKTRMIEHGFYMNLYNNLTTNSKYRYMRNFYKIRDRETRFAVLSLSKLRGAFYLLIFGYYISLVVFILELWYYRKGKRVIRAALAATVGKVAGAPKGPIGNFYYD